MRPLFGIVFIAWLLGMEAAAAQDVAANRILTLRGGDVLAALASPSPPVVAEISVSPNGEYAVVLEATFPSTLDTQRRSFIGVGMARPGTRLKLWLVATATGSRTAVGGLTDDMTPYQAGSVWLEPKWSADSSQFALLEQDDQASRLVVWQTLRPEHPTTIVLPTIPRGQYASSGYKSRIVRWAWWPNHARLLLETEDLRLDAGSNPGQSTGSDDPDFITWAWFLSRMPRARGGIHRIGNLYVIDIESRTVRTALVTNHENPYRRTWSSAPDASALFSTRDLRHIDPETEFSEGGHDNGFQLWAIANDDPRAAGTDTMLARLYRYHPNHGVRLVTSARPGAIGDAFDVGGGRAVFLEQNPALTVWPLSGTYARLRLREGTGSVRDVANTPFDFASDIIGVTPARDVVILTGNPNSANRELWRVNLVSGAGERISPPGIFVSAASMSVEGGQIVAALESSSTPPILALWSAEQLGWRDLSDSRASNALQAPLGTADWISWQSADARFEMSGILVKPSSFDVDRLYPLVVCISGGDTGGTQAHQNIFDPAGVGMSCGVPAHVLAAAGYLVFLPNHRHVSGVGHAENAALIGHYGDHVTLDIEAGIDALIANGLVDPARVGIAGSSHGGVGVMYALTHSQRYKAAWINDGVLFSEIILESRSAIDGPRDPFGTEVQAQLLGFDPATRTWADPFAVRSPIMLRFSGLARETRTLDDPQLATPYVDFLAWLPQVHRLQHALQSNSVPFDIMIDREWHIVARASYRLEYQSRMLDWFDFFLRGQGASPIPAAASPIDYSEDFESVLVCPPAYEHWHAYLEARDVVPPTSFGEDCP